MTEPIARPGASRHRAARLAVVLSVATAAAWIGKDTAIVAAGGRLGVSPLEGPLFLVGLALAVVTAAVLGVAAAGLRTRSRRRRAAGAVVSIVVVSLLGTLAQLLVASLRPARPGWEWAEMNLWVVAAALLVGSLVVDRLAHRPGSERSGLPGPAGTPQAARP